MMAHSMRSPYGGRKVFLVWQGNSFRLAKFDKESDLWVQLDEESVWRKEGFSQMAREQFPFGKGTVELILRDWTVSRKDKWMDKRSSLEIR
jgi:hypothetical protein